MANADHRQTAHIISHTHWDREWYLPYEKHHVRLIALMDTLLDTLENDEEYRSFYLDGQTIIIEDYLQVRPEERERLEKWIREGRIHIGPWYVLQDAFLTSSEANVRNLQIGHQDAAQYGTIAKVGYFPDTFGNIGQAPQLMKQAGIDNAVFGRGVKPTGFNNMVSDSAYESSFSELVWEGPDGSQVLGILFANWYSNGNEVPVDEAEAKEYWDRKLADAGKYASTGQLLFMNGCDHQPIQTDLAEAIRVARKLYPDTDFVHSNFPDYLASLKSSLEDKQLSVVRGELRSQRTDGWSTLVNTASARVYLKQMNQVGQTILEKVAEPLAAFAHMTGKTKYPHHLLKYAWKTLMQNHPHDSICGCSVDEVHREMVTRFDKSRHVAETIVDDSKHAVAGAVDTSVFANYGKDALPLVAFNTTGWTRSGVVEIELDVARVYFREGIALNDMIRMMKEVSLEGRTLVDADGTAVEHTFEDLGLQFGYDLPDDKFRQPYWTRRVKLTFEATAVPALGLKTYAWVLGAAGGASLPSLVTGSRTLANGNLSIEIAEDGTLAVTDIASGRTYRDLLIYEDAGDIGNEYMFKQPDGEPALTTKGLAAEIRVIEDNAYRASFEIVHHWSIPASADELFEQEKQEAVYYPERKAGRSTDYVPFTIRTVVSLERSGRGVGIRTTFNNQAKDHRVRALFPTDLAASVHRADAIFEVAVRDNEPAAEWENPSNAQHQQAFADVSDGTQGLTIANLGLNEYEVLRDGRNTIAVTLLRSVSELGDWGVFPTPEAQCLGEQTVELLILPHGGDGAATGAYAAAYQFQAPWTLAQTSVHGGTLSPEHAFLAWEGEGIAFSSAKIAEASGDLMLRWFNMRPEAAKLQALPNVGSAAAAYASDVLEQAGERLQPSGEGANGSFAAELGPCEIYTVGIKTAQ
ncbi:glycosyl hydrolase [Paenibacillus glycanilyticus]|uniref:Glycosyl hydrolase n=1 Tax=Paenibacillus glycanilyticus TaxID=126569 RepID=A0ABQ6NS72_9BACL|nr:alpha-mannosidase [Paenibacillus glycanilyticus]GMK47374.1 glycosyl hydrolase [Paenibacillus glycanilyticus]